MDSMNKIFLVIFGAFFVGIIAVGSSFNYANQYVESKKYQVEILANPNLDKKQIILQPITLSTLLATNKNVTWICNVYNPTTFDENVTFTWEFSSHNTEALQYVVHILSTGNSDTFVIRAGEVFEVRIDFWLPNPEMIPSRSLMQIQNSKIVITFTAGE